MLAFTAFEWARLKFGAGDGGFSSALGGVSVLEALEWLLILQAARVRGDRAPGGLSAFVTLGAVAVIVLPLGQKPIVALALLAIVALGLGWRRAAPWTAAGSLALLVSQYALTGWPFLSMHNVVGRLDAAVTRALLHAGGQNVAGGGSLVWLPSRKQAFDVMWGCATSTTLVEILPAYLLVALCLRGRLVRRDGLGMAGLTALVFPLNWIRLQLICAPGRL